MSEQFSNIPGMRILPVNDILSDSFKMVWRERHDFMAMAAIPIVVLALIATGINYSFPDKWLVLDETGAILESNPAIFLLGFLKIVFYVMFAVAWHRRCLMPQLRLTVASALKWDRDKTDFLLRMIGIFVIIFLPMILLPIAGIIAGFLIFSRLALVLPATAIHKPISYKKSWAETKGNSWRMLWLSLAPSIVFSVAIFVATYSLASIFGVVDGRNTLTGLFIIIFVQECIDYAGVAVGVAALSNAYRFFSKTTA